LLLLLLLLFVTFIDRDCYFVIVILFCWISLIVTAFLGTTGIFVCFSLSALIAPRRSLLYLGGILGSCLSFLFWASLLNIFFRSYFVFQLELYLGLFVFCGYVLYDTQLLLVKVEAGDRDYIMHAVGLFINFVAIFVRLLIILLKNRERDRNERKRR